MNNIEILIYLFEEIFFPDYMLKKSNMTPYHTFARYGLLEALAYCIKLGIQPNYKTPITNKDYPAATALHVAAAHSQFEMCKKLIKFGVNIDSKDLNGNTALHYAAAAGSIPIVKLLFEFGVSMFVKNKKL